MKTIQTVLTAEAFQGSFANNSVEDALYDMAFTISPECAVPNPRKRSQNRGTELCYGAVATWLTKDFAHGDYRGSAKSIYFYQLETLNGSMDWDWRDTDFDYADHVILVDGNVSDVLVDVYRTARRSLTEGRYTTEDGRIFILVRRVPVLAFVNQYFTAPTA